MSHPPSTHDYAAIGDGDVVERDVSEDGPPRQRDGQVVGGDERLIRCVERRNSEVCQADTERRQVVIESARIEMKVVLLLDCPHGVRSAAARENGACTSTTRSTAAVTRTPKTIMRRRKDGPTDITACDGPYAGENVNLVFLVCLHNGPGARSAADTVNQPRAFTGWEPLAGCVTLL